MSEEEAAATVLGLKDVATGTHAVPADAAISAMAKIVQVLPAGIRRRVSGLSSVAGPLESNRATITDVTVLTTIALAAQGARKVHATPHARDTDTLEFAYQGIRSEPGQRTAQPHHIVNFEHRFYLVAWDTDRGDWRTFPHRSDHSPTMYRPAVRR
ncbi:YafY family protein [Yimella sp. RIT 621]|uniref:helix-turn-helix transcriptional regulator n=1 Tax=Yimella sp. RIT 621 TaxID=2510323 RepID=UPI00210098E9|nr:WYL domain-containing protein [Yimella sp. RIT 621]